MRQLESMIRLSEAMARMEISDEVLPKHVKEAYRLLNKSIIRVEQPDIHLDKDQEMVDGDVIAEEPETQEETPAVQKKKLVLSFEEYKMLSNMIVIHMRREEARSEEDSSEGMRRSGLIDWYLNKIIDQIESEDELVEKKQLIEKVIDRLIYHDNVIIELSKVGLKGSQEEQEEDDPLLVVHPSYIID